MLEISKDKIKKREQHRLDDIRIEQLFYELYDLNISVSHDFDKGQEAEWHLRDSLRGYFFTGDNVPEWIANTFHIVFWVQFLIDAGIIEDAQAFLGRDDEPIKLSEIFHYTDAGTYHWSDLGDKLNIEAFHAAAKAVEAHPVYPLAVKHAILPYSETEPMTHAEIESIIKETLSPSKIAPLEDAYNAGVPLEDIFA